MRLVPKNPLQPGQTGTVTDAPHYLMHLVDAELSEGWCHIHEVHFFRTITEVRDQWGPDSVEIPAPLRARQPRRKRGRSANLRDLLEE
jgi:hypothetical protein